MARLRGIEPTTALEKKARAHMLRERDARSVIVAVTGEFQNKIADLALTGRDVGGMIDPFQHGGQAVGDPAKNAWVSGKIEDDEAAAVALAWLPDWSEVATLGNGSKSISNTTNPDFVAV